MSEYAWNIQTSRCLIVETSNRCPPPPPPLPSLRSVYTFRQRFRRLFEFGGIEAVGKMAPRRVDIRVVGYFFRPTFFHAKRGGAGERGVVASISRRGRERRSDAASRRNLHFEGEKGETRRAPVAKEKGKRKRVVGHFAVSRRRHRSDKRFAPA